MIRTGENWRSNKYRNSFTHLVLRLIDKKGNQFFRKLIPISTVIILRLILSEIEELRRCGSWRCGFWKSSLCGLIYKNSEQEPT